MNTLKSITTNTDNYESYVCLKRKKKVLLDKIKSNIFLAYFLYLSMDNIRYWQKKAYDYGTVPSSSIFQTKFCQWGDIFTALVRLLCQVSLHSEYHLYPLFLTFSQSFAYVNDFTPQIYRTGHFGWDLERSSDPTFHRKGTLDEIIRKGPWMR